MNRKVVRQEKLKEEYIEYSHESGLKIILYRKPGFLKKYAYLQVGYGSLNNEIRVDGSIKKLPYGLAHFLEHKIFENEEINSFERFASLGANVNAYTSFDSTVYHFSTIDNYETCLEELIKMVSNLQITPENVEKEKGIIVEELKMYEDNPHYKVFFQGIKKLYSKHPIGEDIGGNESSVMATTFDDLMAAYDSFYRPSNMTLLIVGDVDEVLIDSIPEMFPVDFISRMGCEKVSIPEELDLPEENSIESVMGVPVPLFNYLIKMDVLEGSMDAYKKSVIMQIALDFVYGKSSEFYDEVYSSGLVSSEFSKAYAYGEGYAVLEFAGDSSNAEGMILKIHDTMERFRESGIDDLSFTKAKNKIIGKLIMSFNSLDSIARAFISYKNRGIGFYEIIDLLESITIDDVNSAFEFDADGKTVLSVVR